MMRKTFLTSALDMPEIMSYIYNKSWKLQFSASSSIIIIEDYYLQTFLHSLNNSTELIFLILFLLFFSHCFIFFQLIQRLATHQIQDHCIEYRHQPDPDIAQIPYKCVRCDSSDE